MTKVRTIPSSIKVGVAACAALMAVLATQAGERGHGSLDVARLDGNDQGNTPVMLSLFTPVEIPWWQSAWDVSGIRFCLPYGSCRDLAGLDVGVVTHSASLCGLQCSAVSVVDDDVRMALAVGGLVNVVGGSLTGLQIGGLVNVVDNDAQALQIGGLVNVVDGSFTGLQVGFVNVISSQAKDAWQIGFWNQGGDYDHSGQIGVFNYARDMSSGIQFGLINIIANNEYPCLPIMNCRF